MNRLKLWVFSLVVAGAAFLALRSVAVSRRAEAIAALDARLASAAGHVGTSFREAGREAAALAAVASRDPALAAALRPQEAAAAPAPSPARGKKPAPPPAASTPADPAAEDARVRDAARAALAAAEKALGLELPAGATAAAASREALARKVEGAAPEGEVTAYLRTAAGGVARRGWLRQGALLYTAAAVPVGDGGALAILVPFDEAWAKALSTAAGVDVTVIAPDVKGASTARAADVLSLQGVTRQGGAADAGRVAGVDLSVGPVRLPPVPQPIAGGWSLRARAVPLENVKGGAVVLSVSAASAAAAPAVFLWRAVLGIAVYLLASLVLGFLIRSTDGPPQVPEELLAAASRIERGDFAARVPPLAGKLGTVAAALNKAAELAGPAQAARAAPEEWFQQAAARAVVPGSPAAAIPGPAAAVAAAPAPTAAGMPAAAVPAPAPRTATGMLSAVSAPVSGDPFAVAEEEAHWQQVFQDFLRTRASCGESTEGLAYEKFRVKLEGNKAQLVAKYGCKTVRFQVYVKEGKAALKATPVK